MLTVREILAQRIQDEIFNETAWGLIQAQGENFVLNKLNRGLRAAETSGVAGRKVYAHWDAELIGNKKDIAELDKVDFCVICGMTFLLSDEVHDVWETDYPLVQNLGAALSYFSTLGQAAYVAAE